MTSTLACGTSEAALWELAEGSSARAPSELLDHVAACDGCQARLAELRRLCSGLEMIGLTDPASLPESIGPYRIVRLIGEGGMGIVYEAEQTGPDRRVALKVTRPLSARGAQVKALQKEIYTLGRLNDPEIAHIYDADRPKTGWLIWPWSSSTGFPSTATARRPGFRSRSGFPFSAASAMPSIARTSEGSFTGI